MIGILTTRRSYVAQTGTPLVAEPLEAYRSAPGLIPRRFVSITSKFINGQSDAQRALTDLVPVYPSETITNTEGVAEEPQFVLRREQAASFPDGGVHWTSMIRNIKSAYESREAANMFITLFRDHAMVFVRDSGAVDFVHVFECHDAVELLYLVNLIFRDRGYKAGEDRIILTGETAPKREAYEIFKNYFMHVWVEDINPLNIPESN